MTTDLHVISGTELDTLLDRRECELFAELRAKGIDPCPDCYTARIDGVCRPCRLDRDPDYSAMCAAQTRLDHEPFMSFEASRRDERIVADFWRKAECAEADAKTEPNACGHCRISARSHGQRWAPGVGFHVFTEPSDGQRLARMYARRAARLGLPVWSRPGASSLPTERS